MGGPMPNGMPHNGNKIPFEHYFRDYVKYFVKIKECQAR